MNEGGSFEIRIKHMLTRIIAKPKKLALKDKPK